ncbi:toxin [Pseudomonas sp. CVAP|uniref:RHS repeat-associated core domain-containing protein n=1 Tax=Pseudomonas sp. CVAP\|nr:RHS repeat-associated core domain-containing protein [Pseudomonas sp. CVAP\
MNTNVHWRTPELKANDPRGLPIRQVAYLRKVAGAEVDTLITRQHHDTLGRLVEQWDPRLFGKAPRPNQATVYRLSGEALRVDSVDAGQRLSLAGLAGEILQHWDQRGHHWRTTYDNQLRVVAIEENAQPKVETFTYADASAVPEHNRRGQMIEQVDRAGALSFSGFSLHGQPLSETRTFPDTQRYTSRRHCSALGAVLTQTDAGDHQQHRRYDIAGQLKQVMLQLDTASARQYILKDAQYNAAGQIIEQSAGNGVIHTRGYDPAGGRLHTLKAGKPGKALCQNLEYVHDRMGNVLRIDDHTLTTVFFANQRVDGHREFSYDSLYRLTCASGFEAEKPNLQPGLPDLITPIDPGHRFNYTEHYQYDHGNNLTTVCHRRDGNNFTREMCIDEHSNRGVRWEEGDPEPIFDELFDPHGNQLWLQRGQPLSWNTRGQLAKVTLLTHSNGLPDDEETYLYSQGARVYKHHVWHTPSANHFHDVHYLPGLEIRTRSDGQQLHVISLSTGVGSVRCLHWVVGKPTDIEPDQLRYHLGDHLDSIALELDRDGAVISHEVYYPFGGTCWWAATSELEANYKTIRYSGKEMDVSGLYYYGLRYYAPWLLHWISADPAGDVDGLNLYAMVGNNPIRYIDAEGSFKTESELRDDIKAFSKNLSTAIKVVDKQNALFEHLFEDKDRNTTIAKVTTFTVVTGIVTTVATIGGGLLGGLAGTLTLPVAGTIGGAGLGAFGAKKAASEVMKKIGKETHLEPSITPKAAELSWEKIKEKNTPTFTIENANQTYKKYDPKTQEGQKKAFMKLAKKNLKEFITYGAKEMIQLGKLSEEANDAQNGLSPMKIKRLGDEYAKLKSNAEADFHLTMENFIALKTNVLFSTGGLTESEKLITLEGVKAEMNIFRAKVNKGRELASRYAQRQGW